MPFAVRPAMVVKAPPTSRSPSAVVARSRTAPLGDGAKPVTAPSALTWARFVRATPPTLENEHRGTSLRHRRIRRR